MKKNFDLSFVVDKVTGTANNVYYYTFSDCNPLFYNETDILYRGNTAKDIWNKDKEKLDFAISMGYKILVVWEHDYKKNKSELLQNCINHFKGLLINES